MCIRDRPIALKNTFPSTLLKSGFSRNSMPAPAPGLSLIHICMQPNERSMIFGLSKAQAAATLAAVLIGHEIIMENGERLLNDDVLNGTVVDVYKRQLLGNEMNQSFVCA